MYWFTKKIGATKAAVFPFLFCFLKIGAVKAPDFEFHLLLPKEIGAAKARVSQYDLLLQKRWGSEGCTL